MPKRLPELESENAKLKKLSAEAHLDMRALKDVFGNIIEIAACAPASATAASTSCCARSSPV
jgi:hypothetical protein